MALVKVEYFGLATEFNGYIRNHTKSAPKRAEMIAVMTIIHRKDDAFAGIIRGDGIIKEGQRKVKL